MVGPDHGKEHKGSAVKKKNPLTVIVFLICVAVFLLSAFKVVTYLIERGEADKAYNDLTHEISVEDENGKDNLSASIDFNALQSINDEIVGWIRIEDTVIDYPVLQTDNNSYYLTHLYNREKNSSGSIFVDAANTDINSDKNVVIYGHSMKNGTMFNGLKKYKDQSYYDEHPEMILFTPEVNYRIEIVSGTSEDGYDDFLKYDFESGEEFIDYVQSFIDRSTFNSNAGVNEDDRIVTLCTCSYEKENARYVVIGRLVPIK